MAHKMKQKIKIMAIIASLSFIIAGLGFGCGMRFEPRGLKPTELSSVGTGPIDAGNNGDLSVVVGAKTVAVTNYRSALDNMLSMTGVAPSTATKNAFNANIGSFSETGIITTINAPMLMAYISVGVEACNDLVNQEKSITTNNRRFFTGFDFVVTNATALKDADLTDTVVPTPLADATRRLARQFWQRNETINELTIVNAGVQNILSAPASAGTGASLPANNTIQSRVATFLCTAIIASTAGYTL